MITKITYKETLNLDSSKNLVMLGMHSLSSVEHRKEMLKRYMIMHRMIQPADDISLMYISDNVIGEDGRIDVIVSTTSRIQNIGSDDKFTTLEVFHNFYSDDYLTGGTNTRFSRGKFYRDNF